MSLARPPVRFLSIAMNSYSSASILACVSLFAAILAFMFVGHRAERLEPLEMSRDSITAIEPAYKDKGKFEFTGTIESVKFGLTKQ